MTTYDVKLERSEAIADGTMAFHFRKPDKFKFKPGQAVELVLVDPQNPAVEIGRHAFSLVSAPFQEQVTVATRMRDSAYKRALRSLPVGAAARIEGPFGSLTLHNDRTRPAVFIAGGIGITPFMSILRQAASDRLPGRLLLLYSNRRPEDAAFLDELQQLEKRHVEFALVATMTQTAKSDRAWDGPIGLIDEHLLGRVAADLSVPVYYLVGPPRMVEAMKETLSRLGVNDDDIRSEEFYGY